MESTQLTAPVCIPARLPRQVIVLLAAAALLASLAFAQTETGQITGTISDPSGALIPEAKVTATNAQTGLARSVATTNAGAYAVTNLPPGLYDVTVEMQGFSVAKKRAQVNVGTRVGLDFVLEVGQTQTLVEVTSSVGAEVNVESQTVGSVILNKQVVELPSLTRNPYDFVATAGNVSENDPAVGRGVGVAINGQRSTSTGILLDGAGNTDDFGAALGVEVPLDSVQEYSILTSNYTAEFGRAGGGIVNVLTKSGTNEFHGTAFWFNRVSRLAANSFDNNANGIPKAVFTRNQFGYAVGGPVVKNKLFFFQNTEWIRVRSQATTTAWAPNAALVNLSDSNTQEFFQAFGARRPDLIMLEEGVTKNQLLERGFDPCAGAASAGGCALLPGSTPMFDRVAYNRPADSGGGNAQDKYLVLGRIDYNISDSTQLYGRFALHNENIFRGYQIYHSPYQGFDAGRVFDNSAYLVSLTKTLSPTTVSQSKVSFSRIIDEQGMGEQPFTPTLYMRTTRSAMLGTNIAFPGYLPYNPGVAIPAGGPQNSLNFYQDFNLVRGAHTFRFGGQYLYMQQNRTFGAFANSVQTLGQNFGGAIDNLLLGQLLQFQGAVDPQGKYPCVDRSNPDPSCIVSLPVGAPNFSRSNLYHEFSLYAQDSWRLSRNVVANLGVRYEYFGVQHNRNPQLDSNYYDGEGASIYERIRNGHVFIAQDSPAGGLWRPDWNNFAPRVGLAWDMFGNGSTSLRGGYGISYERNFGNVTFNVIQNPPGYAVLALIAPADIPMIPISTDNAGPLAGSEGSKALPPVSLRNVDSDIRTAYAHFWSASLERRIGQSMVAAIDYVGSRGMNLYTLEDPNKVGYGNAFLGDPCTPGEGGGPGSCTARLRTSQYTALNRRSGKGFSDYHGMNLRFDITDIGRTGLTFRTNYTWAHAIDNLSSTFSENDNNFNLGLLDPFNPRLDKGNADFDVRHRIAVSGVWELPFARSLNGFAKAILDGWSVAPILTARTGNALTVFDCSFAAFAVCPRAMFDGPVPGTGQAVPIEGVPNSFSYFDFTNAPVNSDWYNPLTGTSEVGPFPSNMSGRNSFRGPGAWNLDLGVYKTTKVSERVSVQLRGEFYNTFNHSNLYVVGADADLSGGNRTVAAQRGVPPTYLGADDRRNIQLALKVIF